jgi:hypothetical protein
MEIIITRVISKESLSEIMERCCKEGGRWLHPPGVVVESPDIVRYFQWVKLNDIVVTAFPMDLHQVKNVISEVRKNREGFNIRKQKLSKKNFKWIITKKTKASDKFSKYLINVGVRSSEYNYSDEVIYENIDYFRRCQQAGLSAYKALLFLNDYLEGDYKI